MSRLNVLLKRDPSFIPDSDSGNLRLYYELELVRSQYESNQLPNLLNHYTRLIDVLGERGQFVDFSSDLMIDKALRKSDWFDVIMKPIPTPSKDESQDDFINRCTSTVSHADPERKHDQVVGICFSQWRESKKKRKSD